MSLNSLFVPLDLLLKICNIWSVIHLKCVSWNPDLFADCSMPEQRLFFGRVHLIKLSNYQDMENNPASEPYLWLFCHRGGGWNDFLWWWESDSVLNCKDLSVRSWMAEPISPRECTDYNKAIHFIHSVLNSCINCGGIWDKQLQTWSMLPIFLAVTVGNPSRVFDGGWRCPLGSTSPCRLCLTSVTLHSYLSGSCPHSGR